jgi:hypothetical protein
MKQLAKLSNQAYVRLLFSSLTSSFRTTERHIIPTLVLFLQYYSLQYYSTYFTIYISQIDHNNEVLLPQDDVLLRGQLGRV